MRIYLDIETYRRTREDAFTNEKVIAIGFIEDRTPYEPSSANKWSEDEGVKFHYLTEWELGGEQTVIHEFYKHLEKFIEERERGEINYIVIVGFNILRFDIPLLIQKGVEYKVDTHAKLNQLWYSAHTIDYLQASLPFHGMRFKGLKLEYLAKKAKEKNIVIPEPFESGEKVVEWYEKEEYLRIIEHLETDLKIIRVVDLNYKRIYGLEPGTSSHIFDYAL